MYTQDPHRPQHRPYSLIALLAVFLAGAALLKGQQATFHAGTDTVSVYATVVDRDGRLVPDLTKDDFQVLDNGQPQPLIIFRNDIQPITIVIMLDRSGSMVGNFKIVRDAAEHFVADLLPADKARIGSFSNRVEIDPPEFTSDVNDLIRILHYDLQDAGPTPLWNATYAAMNALEHQEGRRVALMFTDGYDNPGRSVGNVTLQQVIDRSQAEEMMVYAIGLSDVCGHAPASAPGSAPSLQRGGRGRGIPRGGGLGGPSGRGPMGGRGRGCSDAKPDPGLKVLADEGGGGYFELNRTDDLAATFARVAEELHHQYLLAFTAPLPDGKLHKLDVRVRAPELTARARKTYLAPSRK
jgi:Ca-activated chloride channel family protein